MKHQTSSLPAEDVTKSSKINNQEALHNGCICPFGCPQCDALAEAFEAMRAALDTIANITEAPHWEAARRWQIGMKARKAWQLAEKVSRGR